MDEFDRKILRALQRNNRQTYDKIGDDIGLSPTAVRRRAKRLRKDKIIIGDVCVLDPDKIGITVIISVRLEKESHSTYEAFKREMKNAQEVVQCYTVSGEVDFVVIAHLKDLQAYDQWIADHLLSNDSIARSDTNIVYSRVKYETAIKV